MAAEKKSRARLGMSEDKCACLHQTKVNVLCVTMLICGLMRPNETEMRPNETEILITSYVYAQSRYTRLKSWTKRAWIADSPPDSGGGSGKRGAAQILHERR